MAGKLINSENILGNLNAGIYVVDPDRKIMYWSEAAERITGWSADEIIGTKCSDGILCHIDKDGHELCSEDYCPLHRAIITGKSSNLPIIVFANSKSGKRVPMKVSVAPMFDDNSNVIGGIETFYDLSEEYGDIRRASQIQNDILEQIPPPTDRIKFNPHCLSNDIIGGDFYAVNKLSENVYRFMLADVAGHGVSAALFTMYLNLLWKEFSEKAESIGKLASMFSDRLYELVGDKSHFVAAICGQVDLEDNSITTVGAGNPGPILFRNNGDIEHITAKGMLLGLVEEAQYLETRTALGSGDKLLFFTDGAIEIHNSEGKMLDSCGLERLLQEQGFPGKPIDYKSVENALLTYSDRIRFDDDVTFLEIALN